MAEELSVVGKRLPRWEAKAKATGAAKFTVDIKLPGMLHAKILASPYAHAKIVKVDKSKALKLPGVEAVISYEDVPKKIYNPNKLDMTLFNPKYEIKDMYILSEKARFIGDKVAAVAAVDAATAEEALELIKVEYEPLPAVFDPFEAMKPGAPVIHDFAKNNIGAHITFAGPRGDIEKGLKEADALVEATFWTGRQQMCQFEPSTCIVYFDANGKLVIYSLSQHVFLHRRKMAEMFDMPEGMVKWITPHTGGGWGKFGSFSAEPVAVILAQKTGKPIKLEYTREEDFLESTRQTYVEKGKIGVSKDGAITALEEKLLVHGGAYFTHNGTTTGVNMGSFTGLYRCPNVAAEADAVYTNLQPTGGVRGYGNSEAAYLLEQLVDMAAEKIGMDPIELRLKNMKKVGDPANTGMPMETFTLDKCIKLGAERFGWKEKRARKKGTGTKRYGVGMACMMHVSGAHPHSTQHRNVMIKLNEDGSANMIISADDMGQNLLGTTAQIAAEVLGFRYEDIHIITGDTDFTLFDQGQHASGGLYQIGNAVIIAANEVKKQVFERASAKLGVTPDKLVMKDRKVYVKDVPEKSLTVAEITKEAIYNFKNNHNHIMGKGHFNAVQNPPPFGATYAEVEVDVETGVVDLNNLVFVVDVGRSINPTTVEGQMEGGVAQAIGITLTEDYYFNKNGALEADNFTTYKIPSSLDMPNIDLIIYEQEPLKSGPFGAKGVGESPMISVTPAIANAVYNAVGVRIEKMPITPEKILQALKEKTKKK